MASLVGDDIVKDSDECHEMHCEQCYEFGETADAEGFCNKCLEYMCQSCLKYHKRQNPQHNILDRAAMPQEYCFEQCPAHQKYIRFYCPKCELFACSDCRKTKHTTCDNINHVSTMATRIEESNELKEALKDIDFISNSLKRVQNTLEDGVKDIETKEKLAQQSIKKSGQSRKSHFEEQQLKCTATFNKYLTDMSSLIEEEKQRTVTQLRKEQNDLDVKLTFTENENLQELRKASERDVCAHRFFLARNASLLEKVKGNSCDLYQYMENKQRCKLLIAMKKSSSEMKKLKQNMLMLTSQTVALKKNTLPDRIITNARSYQALVKSQSTEYDGNKSTDHPSQVTRKIQVLRCSNGACGKEGYGKFCKQCGHRFVRETKFGIFIICKGKLEDGQNCNSELLPGKNCCIRCGMKVERSVQQVLEDKFKIQNLSKIDHSLEDEIKYVNLNATKSDGVHMARICMVTDDEITKMHLIRKAKSFLSSLDTKIQSCCAKISYSLKENQVVLSHDAAIIENVNFELVLQQLQSAEDIFHSFLGQLVVKNIYIQHNSWCAVMQIIEEINLSNPENVAVMTDLNLHGVTVSILGKRTLVEEVFQIISSVHV